MALFQGEEMVDVTTPDGRTLTVPRSLVPPDMMPQQQIAQSTAPAFSTPAQQPTEETATPTLPAPDTAAPEAPPAGVTPYAPGVVDMGEPTVREVSAQQLAKERAKQQAAELKQAKAQRALAASPQGKLAGAEQTQTAAMQGQKDALLKEADVEGATQAVVADAVTARNQQLDKLFAQRDTDMRTAAEAEDKKMNEIVGMRKKIAGAKIDRSLDHPIALAISAALVGLGETMAGQKVTAGEIISNAIDRKVQAQMANLDQMGKIYGMTKEELDMLKDKSKRKLELYNTMIAGETDKAVRHIEELTARSASEKTKARAQSAIAELQARAADKTMEATRWGLEYDQKDRHQKQQIGLGYANLAESRRATDLNAQLKREDMYLDQQKYLAGLRAKGDEEAFKAQAKQVEEVGKRGLRDMTGDLFLTPEGRAKMAQAQQLEDDAKALEANPDPMQRSIASDKIALMRQKASMLRGEAQTANAILAHTDTEAVTVSNMIASGQDVVQLIDGIKELSNKAGRGLISRDDAQAQVQAMFAQLKPGLKEAWQLGAWDKGASGLVSEVIGQDPSSEWNAGTLGALIARKMYENPKAFQTRLDTVATQLEQKAKNKLVGLGTKFGKDDKVLHRAEPQAQPSESAVNLLESPSGTEFTKNAEQVGVVGKAARQIGYPFSPDHAQEADNAQSQKYIGLSKAQEAPFEERLQAYKKGDKKAADELVQITAQAAQSRPDLAVTLLQTLQEHAPQLYPAARAAIPKDSEADKVMTYSETNRIGVSDTPTALLAPQVRTSVAPDGTITDQEGLKELARRATQTPPDRVAKWALADIFTLRTTNESTPQGSVFREGR